MNLDKVACWMCNGSINFTDSLKMDLMKYCWSFIRSQGFKFLDCEITSASGVKLLTNKCFLIISNLLWKCLDHRINGKCKILMPSFNDIEIRKELRGFVVQCDQSLNPIQSSLENQTFISSSSNQQMKGQLPNQIIKSSEDNQTLATYQEKQSYQWQCEHCGKGFQTSKQCRQHRYQVHKGRLQQIKCKCKGGGLAGQNVTFYKVVFKIHHFKPF